MGRLLSTADIARMRGCDRTTAWRIVARVRKIGARVYEQRGKIYIEETELREFVARLASAKERAMVRQMGELRRRLDALEPQFTALMYELRGLRGGRR